ncbi:MAG: hypothetical protein LBI78_02155 [Campylobacteraceae bacterium]|jgi:hypothetical protein|nr:hypothetical protein [Campylobacteraceae bacterium]
MSLKSYDIVNGSIVERNDISGEFTTLEDAEDALRETYDIVGFEIVPCRNGKGQYCSYDSSFTALEEKKRIQIKSIKPRRHR